MRSRDFSAWMRGDAISFLERAERLHRLLLHAGTGGAGSWEPPVDIVEDDANLIVQVALPGVPAEAITVELQPGGIAVTGVRCFPARRSGRIHRIEIPYGRFERRISLPVHALGPARWQLSDGCLLITFRKSRDTP